MQLVLWTILILTPLVLGGVLARMIFRNPRGDFDSGIAFLIGRAYVKLVHNLRIHNREHIPTDLKPGPIIIVANHTAGIDPILIQASCPFEIRWIMASDMRATGLEWFWKWQKIIFVGRDRNSTAVGLRTAIEHLQDHGVVGIFPEGGLERPPRHILPFHPGFAMLVRKTGARILPVFIDDTPQIDPAWASLWKPSRSTISFGPLLSFDRATPANEITEKVRTYFIERSGWPVNDHPDQVDIDSGKTMGPYARRLQTPEENERSVA